MRFMIKSPKSNFRVLWRRVAVALVGIVAVGLAGRLKEGEMSDDDKKKAVAEFNFRKGIVTAAFPGTVRNA